MSATVVGRIDLVNVQKIEKPMCKPLSTGSGKLRDKFSQLFFCQNRHLFYYKIGENSLANDSLNFSQVDLLRHCSRVTRVLFSISERKASLSLRETAAS